MMRAEQLDTLAAQVRRCRICVEHPCGKPLPHEPRPVFTVSAQAKILIAGQAPGTKVNLSGVPFTDRSGDTLRDWLGVDRQTFYDPDKFAILPMGFCFPGQDAKGGDLPPRKECAPAWRQKLLGLMPQLELVVLIGMYAQAWHLGNARSATLTQTVANWKAILEMSSAQKLLPLPHPSWRSRIWMKSNPWFERDVLPFLKFSVASLI